MRPWRRAGRRRSSLPLTVGAAGSGAQPGDGCAQASSASCTARGGNRRFWLLRALRAHTKAPYKTDLNRKTLRALNRPREARTVESRRRGGARGDEPRRARRRAGRADVHLVLHLLTPRTAHHIKRVIKKVVKMRRRRSPAAPGRPRRRRPPRRRPPRTERSGGSATGRGRPCTPWTRPAPRGAPRGGPRAPWPAGEAGA
jgi:hypothetical protein